MSESIEDIIRRVVREEIAAAFAPSATKSRALPPAPLTALDPAGNGWRRVDSYGLKSGSKTFTIKPGYPCKVQGERGDWKIVAIEVHSDGRVNVEATKDRTGHSRIFPITRITYRRPPKVAA